MTPEIFLWLELMEGGLQDGGKRRQMQRIDGLIFISQRGLRTLLLAAMDIIDWMTEKEEDHSGGSDRDCRLKRQW